MSLNAKELEQLVKKLGKEQLEVAPGLLVDILNKKYEKKSSGKPFNWSDIQQYYLRGSIPQKYGGLKLELCEGPLGKYLKIDKTEE